MIVPKSRFLIDSNNADAYLRAEAKLGELGEVRKLADALLESVRKRLLYDENAK